MPMSGRSKQLSTHKGEVQREVGLPIGELTNLAAMKNRLIERPASRRRWNARTASYYRCRRSPSGGRKRVAALLNCATHPRDVMCLPLHGFLIRCCSPDPVMQNEPGPGIATTLSV